MGAWGPGLFEDDTALDFVLELKQQSDAGLLLRSVTEAANSPTSVDYEGGTRALAAAEVIAALGKRPAKDLPDEVSEWLSNRGIHFSTHLGATAIAAVEKVQTASEISELWAESPESALWRENVADLLARLRAASQ